MRIFLQQPRWLFLDEATSALDEATEAYLYEQLQVKLPQTTCISVGHRSTLRSFHPLALTLHKEGHCVTEEMILP